MSEPLVLIDNSDPLVTAIALNRPLKRNALSVQLIEELRAAVVSTAEDLRRRVLILRGNGPVFCAGLDLQEASTRSVADRSAKALADLYEVICRSPLVTIAAAQGAAMGGGVGILAACDLVVADDALRIGFPEVRRGLVAALVTALVRRQIADRAIRELVLLGQTITATEAQSLGLVNCVVPLARLLDESRRLAAIAIQGAPGAITRTKHLLDDLASRPIAEDLRCAMRFHLEARDSEESTEGILAFREKRKPRWGMRPPRPTDI